MCLAVPMEITGINESVPRLASLANLGTQGPNDFRKTAYGGPCQPGATHRYFFKVFALDAKVKLDSSATKADLVEAMEGHILAQGQLMGKFGR